MLAIEIKDLCKNFKQKQAVCGLCMNVPVGSIYGFIGENGSGKSTTEKIMCGLVTPTSGHVKIFGKDYQDKDVRQYMSSLIETPGCFPNSTVWNNLMLQATNLALKNPQEEVRKVLRLVRMEGAAGNKYKNCSLGMKQRVGIAMALLGNPKLLILDEPINGLDVDGMRIMREILTNLAKKEDVTILISSHILGELEKIATHYGIIRNGKMIKEMTSDEFEKECRTYIAIKTNDVDKAKYLLHDKYKQIQEDETGYLRIYDNIKSSDVVKYLYNNSISIEEVKIDKVGLEEYYIDLMKEKRDIYGK